MADNSTVLSGLVLSGVEPTGEDLGKGGSGVTYKVSWNGTICAAKKIHSVLLELANALELHTLAKNFVAECEANSLLRHPNLVQFLGIYYPPNSILPALVMELMFTSLSRYLEVVGDLEIGAKISILHDSSLGLCYLHNHKPPIIHRDLTANNILLTKSMTAKITDLGMAKILDKHQATRMTTAPGLPAYMPPEALGKHPSYTTALDVFSFGALMLHTGAQDWPIPSEYMIVDPVTQDMKYLNEVQRRQEYLNKLQDAEMLRPLIVDCLQNNYTKRPSIINVSKQLQLLKETLPKKPLDKSSSLDRAVSEAEDKMASLEVDKQKELLLLAKEDQLEKMQKEMDKLNEDKRKSEALLKDEIKSLKEKLDNALKATGPIKKEVVWVDANINNGENSGIQYNLRRDPNIHLFATTNIDEAVGVLKNQKPGVEYRAVTSGRLGEDFTTKVRDRAKLKCKILVFCMGVDYHRRWAANFPNVFVTNATLTMLKFATWTD